MSDVGKIVHPKKRAFLARYRVSGNIRASCEAAGVKRQTYYDWCEHDDAFAIAAQVAKEEYGDMLEERLGVLAFEDRNPTALIVALKMAGRFVEKSRQEVSGPDGQAQQFTLRIDRGSEHDPDGIETHSQQRG